jgi:hypothetical protein
MSGTAHPVELESPVSAAIAAAEEVHDPLDGLVERTNTDPGAPFSPDVLEALAALKIEDRAGFETLRAELKRTDCRVTELDQAIAVQNGDVGGREPKQADILIGLTQSVELFHSPDRAAFADIDINGHRETWPIRHKDFKRWLARQFYEATGGAPNSEALQSALNVIEARACFDGPERPIFVRIGGIDGKIYLDLGDATWRAVEIAATGWQVVGNPPVRFRRSAGMRPLPLPTKGGSIEALRSLLNVKSDSDLVLAVTWILACLRDRGPYPVLVLAGEQGSAKSTFSAILRALVDPNTAPLRALPREDRDLFIAASNGYVLSFDNVSGLSPWISDTLCRLATGGGFAVRQLYTDQDEVLFEATRPIILNGIEDIVARPDLADRALFLTLEPIPKERRRTETDLWAVFEAECAGILGVLLDAVVGGLKRLPDTRLEGMPRMADFALWGTACESALWPAGAFMAAYSRNLDQAVDTVIEADLIASAVRDLMTLRTVWTGTASDLLDTLSGQVGEKIAKAKEWPKTPRALSGRLRRAATTLRAIEIDVSFEKEGRARTRNIRLSTINPINEPENAGIRPSAPSAPSAEGVKAALGNGSDDVALRTVLPSADANGGKSKPSTVREKSNNSINADGADGTDANGPTKSAPATTGTGDWGTRV